MPFPQRQMRANVHLHAQARLLLALSRVTQRQERSERFEAQRHTLVGDMKGT